MFSPKKGAGKTNSDEYPPTAIARQGVSPWFLGKPVKKKNTSTENIPVYRPPVDDDDIFIEDNEPENGFQGRRSTENAEQRTTKSKNLVTEGPYWRECFERGLNLNKSLSKRSNNAGLNFDFSADPKVKRVRNKLSEAFGSTGIRENNEELKKNLEHIPRRGIETPNAHRKKPRNAGITVASIKEFTMATGGEVVREVRQVVPSRTNSDKLSDNDSQPKSYPGPRKIPSFTAPIVKKAMEMDTAGGGKDEAQGLHAEPSLKNFDEHIISLIESEIMSVSTSIGWSDVAGLEGAKQSLREIVVWPFQRPDLFKGLRAPPKGVLLFGPPGTGKTMIGRCVASQCNATFFNISASSLTSKWVGEGEKLVRALFAVARLKLPSIIFIDEIDSILSARSETEHESSRRIKTEFLVQIDGVATSRDERLLVLGATNRPQELDEAARRRFAKRLYIALPEKVARVTIVRNLLHGNEHVIDESGLDTIAEITEGYSGADMYQLCTEAAMGPVRDVNGAILEIEKDELRPINLKDFMEAAEQVRPTVVQEDLLAYEKMTVQKLNSVEEYNQFVADPSPALVHFYAAWAAACDQTNALLQDLIEDDTFALRIAFLEAETLAEVSRKMRISAAPTLIYYRKSKEVARVNGYNPAEIKEKALLTSSQISASDALPAAGDAHISKEALNEKLKKLINHSPLMIFIKGKPDAPKCGFSRQLIQLLDENNLQYGSFDILSNEDVRQGLKEYSNWPTYPQLYLNGELLGGLDVIKAELEDPEFVKSLPTKKGEKELNERLKEIISSHQLMLFMKGTKTDPQCGYSRTIVGLLNDAHADFGTFDILKDNEVREGLKKFSNWPTYPQLYLDGELVGGLDIVKEELLDTHFLRRIPRIRN
ncbi:unnamed protein product [Caenorhabditis auriculariae]|uniref:Fidgetin-like protein 1 n=1 Tax=Caenorhabditis auriculariae TaxID=2777116 RepID=A0A8S1HNC9_9PELO|nr:unnamed protein product [Caenorhabditis auriculariae]